LRPRTYSQAIFCQLIQVLRAVQLREPPAVDGEAGRLCLKVIEAARGMARPLEKPWLSRRHQEAHRSLHWSNA
jgi:hypothetical protein